MIALVTVAMLLRLGVVGISIGSDDVLIWEQLARSVFSSGLQATYALTPWMNHPPLAGLLMALAYDLSQSTGLPFAWFAKVPALAGDVLTLAVILGMVRAGRLTPGSAWLFALSPLAILMSGYHGNTDPLVVGLVLAAFAVHQRGRPTVVGLLMAAAFNIKLIALIFLPVLFMLAKGVDERRKLLMGTAVGLAPFIPLLISAPDLVLRRILGYAALPQRWGLFRILGTVGMESSYASIGRWVVLVGIGSLALAAVRRTRPPSEHMLLAAGAFLVLTPGFGVQYLAPLPALLSIRGSVFRHVVHAVAALFAISAYWTFLIDGYPLRSQFRDFGPFTERLGLLLWSLLVIDLWRSLRSAARGEKSGARPPPADS